MTADHAYVVGAGGHAKVVVATLQAAGYDVRGLFDSDASLHGTEVLGTPVLGSDDDPRLEGAPAVVAIGSNRVRRMVAQKLEGRVEWVTPVHPSAVVHPSVTLGPGTVVFAKAVLQPEVVVGAHAIINTGATVDHDGVLGDYVHVAPGTHLAGAVCLDEGAFLGVGGSAIPGVRVGAWTTVGAGGTVTADLPPGCVAVGTPARVVREQTAP